MGSRSALHWYCATFPEKGLWLLCLYENSGQVMVSRQLIPPLGRSFSDAWPCLSSCILIPLQPVTMVPRTITGIEQGNESLYVTLSLVHGMFSTFAYSSSVIYPWVDYHARLNDNSVFLLEKVKKIFNFYIQVIGYPLYLIFTWKHLLIGPLITETSFPISASYPIF